MIEMYFSFRLILVQREIAEENIRHTTKKSMSRKVIFKSLFITYGIIS